MTKSRHSTISQAPRCGLIPEPVVGLLEVKDRLSGEDAPRHRPPASGSHPKFAHDDLESIIVEFEHHGTTKNHHTYKYDVPRMGQAKEHAEDRKSGKTFKAGQDRKCRPRLNWGQKLAKTIKHNENQAADVTNL